MGDGLWAVTLVTARARLGTWGRAQSQVRRELVEQKRIEQKKFITGLRIYTTEHDEE